MLNAVVISDGPLWTWLLRGVFGTFNCQTVTQEMYADVVEYYGENARTLPPTTFFSLFVRFIKAFKVCDCFITADAIDDDDDDDTMFLGSTQCRSLIQV